MKYDVPGDVDKVKPALPAKIPLPTRNQMSPAKRLLRDRSTKGSPPFGHSELSCGYRKI